MIYLFEQYGYDKKGYLDIASEELCAIIPKERIARVLKRKKNDATCFSIDYDEIEQKHRFETSYFIGVDWIVEDKRAICIQPKQNKSDVEINYLKMLLDALEEPENFNHLDELCEIEFDKPRILISQKQDLLSPFLMVQFLQLLKQIVRKGLKKSYFPVTQNLNARTKGKILVSTDIRVNKIKGNHIKTVCKFQEFGTDCDENRILKKAYLFCRRAICNYEMILDVKSLQQIINYIHPAFENISDDIEISKIKSFKRNPLYKEYNQALKLAQLILKRYAYNITLTAQQKISTPPFWIDMSKLFELYVYKKLREVFDKDEVKYHFKAYYQELDFVVKSKDGNSIFVIDAKYKPKYKDHSVSKDDIRQISGYARLKKVYEELELNDYDKNINCLIIYSHQDGLESFRASSFIHNDEPNSLSIMKEENYVNIFKIGVKLPEIESLN